MKANRSAKTAEGVEVARGPKALNLPTDPFNGALSGG